MSECKPLSAPLIQEIAERIRARNAVIPIRRQLGHADLKRLTELFAAIDVWRLREVPNRALEDSHEETDDDLTVIPPMFKRESVKGGEA